MLLRDLTIENYRSFEKYRLNNLARVNLLVGDNNCGKTSVLEAAFLLVHPEPIDAIPCVTEARSERWFVDAVAANEPVRVAPDVCGMFPNGNVELGARIQVTSSSVQRDFLAEVKSRTEGVGKIELDEFKTPRTATKRLDVERKNGKIRVSRRIVMSSNGGLFDRLWIGSDGMHSGNHILRDETPVKFLSLGGWTVEQLASHWTAAIQQGRKEYIQKAMKVIHNEIVDINFPGGQGVMQGRSSVLLTIAARSIPARLSEFGDGSFRLLQLATAMAGAEKGVVLIDEIDTGLHYSRLADMWRMVIQTAKDLDVQVFATTHSLDCLNGLTDAINAQPEFADEVAVHRIERSIDEAVTLDGEQFLRAMKRESEVR